MIKHLNPSLNLNYLICCSSSRISGLSALVVAGRPDFTHTSRMLPTVLRPWTVQLCTKGLYFCGSSNLLTSNCRKGYYLQRWVESSGIRHFNVIWSHVWRKIKICCFQAAVAWAAGELLKIEQVDVAPPQAMEVRIKIHYTGSDVTFWQAKV